MVDEKDKSYGYASGWSESGFDASIPVWDGRPDSLREFRRTVTWWLSSIDLTKTKFFNLAARFAMKQRGSARLRALEFTPEDLAYLPEESVDDPDKEGEKIIIQAADYTVGVWKLIDAWEQMVGKTVSDKKGELRERFYMTLRRSPTEAVMTFSLRYRTLVAEMRAEGITLDDAESAWFYKQKLVLNEVQKQLLETTLSSTDETYADCEREAVRLFKRIHMTGGHAQPSNPGSIASLRKAPFRPPGSGKGGWRRPMSSSSTTVSASSSFSRGSSSRMGLGASAVNVTEAQDPDYEDQDGEFEAMEAMGEEDMQAEMPEADALQGLQDEVEVLASELEAAPKEGCDSQELDALEEQLEGAVEALVTLREARTQIAAMRKDRGFRGPAPGSQDPKKAAKQGTCHVCGREGHWKGDPECPGPGHSGTSNSKGKGGKKGRLQSALKGSTGKRPSESHVSEANIVDLLPPVPEVTFDDGPPEVHEVFLSEHQLHEHEVCGIERLSEVLQSLNSNNNPQISHDKLLQAALDSACNRSCAGVAWIKHTEEALQRAPSYVQSLIRRTPEQERFRFGNGGVLTSWERVRLPMLLANRIVLIWVSSVPSSSLGLLVGKDFLDSLGAVIDFLHNRVKFQLLADDHWVRLHKLKAGHFAVPCLPTPLHQWPELSSLPWIPIGRDACCEIQIASKEQWILKRLHKSVSTPASEVNVTEHFVPAVFLEQEAAEDLHPWCAGMLLAAEGSSSSALGPDAGEAAGEESLALAGHFALDDPAPISERTSTSASISLDFQPSGSIRRPKCAKGDRGRESGLIPL